MFYLLLCIISVVAPLHSFDRTDREIAKQFEQLATNSLGVLPQLSSDIRARRIGPVMQKVTISGEGVLTIEQNFICKSLDGTEKIPGRSSQRFYLSDLKQKTPNKRYEVNRHVNTISLFYGKGLFVLSFSSERDLEKAAKLLETLVMRAPQVQRVQGSLSELAKQCGYKYLVIAPRAQSYAEGFRLLHGGEQSPCLLSWLTKHTPDQIGSLLAESRNGLPLLLYDISLLDTVPFYTQAIPHLPSFSTCTLGEEMEQSVVSDDMISLRAFFEKTPFAGIRFEKVPDFAAPLAIVCKALERNKLQKYARAEKIQTHDVTWYPTKVLHDEEIPRGTVSSWFTGLHENSDDILRYCLLEEPLVPSIFSGTLYREFPLLESLLQCKGRYRKECSIFEGIVATSCALSKQQHLSPQQRHIVKVALFSHELGSPFGSHDQVAYNSWPIALCIAEKVGLSELEGRAVKALIEAPLPCDDKKMKLNEPLAFLEEARTASQIGIAPGEWLEMKVVYWRALSSLWKKVPEQTKNAIAFVAGVRRRYAVLCPFGISRGLSAFKGPLEIRGLFSTYIWELRDAQHREGLPLKRRRDKYEHMLVDNPSSAWKGHFWDWLSKESQGLFPNTYLSREELEAYRAVFSEGRLVHPTVPQGEVEMMFVIDDWGHLYLATKKEAENKEVLGFNHASFLSGGPVASAGKLVFKDGYPTVLTDRSGHYRATIYEVVRALKVLEQHGVDIETLSVSIDCDTFDQEALPSGKTVLAWEGNSPSP